MAGLRVLICCWVKCWGQMAGLPVLICCWVKCLTRSWGPQLPVGLPGAGALAFNPRPTRDTWLPSNRLTQVNLPCVWILHPRWKKTLISGAGQKKFSTPAFPRLNLKKGTQRPTTLRRICAWCSVAKARRSTQHCQKQCLFCNKLDIP